MMTQTEDSQCLSTLNAESQKTKRREHFKQKMSRIWFSSSRCEKTSVKHKDGDERQRRHHWRRWRSQSEPDESTESVQQEETIEETASHSDSCFSTCSANKFSAQADDENASSQASHETVEGTASHSDSCFSTCPANNELPAQANDENAPSQTSHENASAQASHESASSQASNENASSQTYQDSNFVNLQENAEHEKEGLLEDKNAEKDAYATASSKKHEPKPSAGLASRVDRLNRNQKKQKALQRPEPGSKTWENMEEETWVAKLLKDYCPLRFRKNKLSNYDSEEFKDDQTFIMFKTLIEQEDREEDQKIVHRPVHNTSKSLFRRWFHFEKDEDILWELTSIHREEPNLYFKGIKPALRKHIFRRWMNFERDRMIASEGLLYHWSRDKDFIPRLKRANQRRLDKLENYRFLEQLFNGPRRKFPPLSFFTDQIAKKIRFGKGPQEPLSKGVPPERTISTHPYFKIQKRRVKVWFKDILLKI